MINLSRPAQVPKSLQDERIMNFLDKLAACRENPELPTPEPPLGYRDLDIIEVFESAFFSKCYLTEQRYDSAAALEIDHFRTVSEAPELRYAWDNLLPISPLANKMRLKRTPEGGYLDPCNPEDDVEGSVVYDLTRRGEEINFAPRDESNPKAKNTALLLNRVHNGHDPRTRQAVKPLQVAIRKRYAKLAERIIDYQAARLNGNQEKVTRLEGRLRRMLSKESEFAMLLRNTSVVRRHLPHLIAE